MFVHTVEISFKHPVTGGKNTSKRCCQGVGHGFEKDC